MFRLTSWGLTISLFSFFFFIAKTCSCHFWKEKKNHLISLSSFPIFTLFLESSFCFSFPFLWMVDTSINIVLKPKLNSVNCVAYRNLPSWQDSKPTSSSHIKELFTFQATVSSSSRVIFTTAHCFPFIWKWQVRHCSLEAITHVNSDSFSASTDFASKWIWKKKKKNARTIIQF